MSVVAYCADIVSNKTGFSKIRPLLKEVNLMCLNLISDHHTVGFWRKYIIVSPFPSFLYDTFPGVTLHDTSSCEMVYCLLDEYFYASVILVFFCNVELNTVFNAWDQSYVLWQNLDSALHIYNQNTTLL